MDPFRPLVAPIGVLLVAMLAAATASALSPPRRIALDAPVETVVAPRARVEAARRARRRLACGCADAAVRVAALCCE